MTRPKQFPWNEEQIAICRDMFGKGKSYKEITQALNARYGEGSVTRSSVGGKMCRLGLLRETDPAKRKGQLRRATVWGAFAGNRSVGDVKRAAKRKAKPNPGPQVRVADIVSRDLPLVALKGDECHYPTNSSTTPGGHLFCGNPVARWGVKYCPAHCALAYRPAEK